MEITLEQKQKLQQLILPFKTGAVPLVDGISSRGGANYAGRISFLQAFCDPQFSAPAFARLFATRLDDTDTQEHIFGSDNPKKILVGDAGGMRLIIGLERLDYPTKYIFADYGDLPQCAISLDTPADLHQRIASLFYFASEYNIEYRSKERAPISGGKISIELGKRKIDVFGESDAYRFIENQNAKVQAALTEFFNAIGWDNILEFAKSHD